jgi:hypothetical protein
MLCDDSLIKQLGRKIEAAFLNTLGFVETETV